MAKKRRKQNERTYVLIMATLLTLAIVGVMALIVVMATNNGKRPPDNEISKAESIPSVGEMSNVDESKSEISGGEEISHADTSDTSSEEPPHVDYETRVGKKYQIDISKYLQYIEPADAEKYTYLVNLSHPISVDYIPEDLVVSQYTRKDGRDGQQLVRTVEKAHEAFMSEAALNGINNVTITSAYRSAKYQDYLFNLYTQQEMDANPSLTREQAEAIVITYSMRPGCSEHQTGLCLDIHNLGSASQAFGDTPEAKWMAENCYRFGFILRYPSDKEAITKVEYEPWHFRFVGREAATVMHEKGMCLEEYTEYMSAQD